MLVVAVIEDNLLPLSGGGDGVDVLEVFPGDEADGLLDLLFGDAVLAGIGKLVVALVGGEIDGVLAQDGFGLALCIHDGEGNAGFLQGEGDAEAFVGEMGKAFQAFYDILNLKHS